MVAVAVLLALVCGMGAAAAQADATLQVTVKDRWGAVPGATVQVTDEGREFGERQISDDAGQTTFSGLAAGTYRVEVALDGFVPYLEEGIELADGGQVAVEAMLGLTQFSSALTVTTANRREQLLLDVAEPTTLIDEIQILDTGGQSAKDVLSEQAGAGVVVEAGGGRGHVSINGVSNKGVLVLIDGRRYLGRNGVGDFNLEDLDMAGAERIEVVKGAGSALYGTDALGGVINIITKKAKQGMQNRFEVTGGSHSDLRISNSYSRRQGKAGLELIGSVRTFGGFDLDGEDPQTQGEPASERIDVQLNGDYQLSDSVVGHLFTNYAKREVDKNFFSGATQLADDVYDQQLDTLRYTISPELDVTLSPSTALNVVLTHGKYERDETQVYPNRVVEVAPWLEWNTEGKATLRQSWRAMDQDQLFQVGFEFRSQEMDRANLRQAGSDSTKVDRDLSVAWFQQEFNFGPRFTFTGGVRYDDDSEYGSETSPKLSAVFAASDKTRLRASYGHGFRAPRFGELFINLGLFFVGNPDLQPETSDSLTAGFTYVGDRVKASVDYFDTELDNAIVFDFSGFPFRPITYRNIPGISTRQGFNTELAVDLPHGFTPSIAFTKLDAEDSSGERLAGFAEETAFAKLLWQDPGRGLRANLRMEYRGEETASSDGTFAPSYTLWNVQASKTMQLGGRKFRFWARADNLTDETDLFRRDASGNPIPGELQVWEDGRNFHVGVAIDIERDR